jgi:hypothetical protein
MSSPIKLLISWMPLSPMHYSSHIFSLLWLTSTLSVIITFSSAASHPPPPPDHAYKSAQRRTALLKAQRYRDALVDSSLIEPEPIDILLNLSITTPSEIMGTCGNVEDIFGCTVDNVYGDDQPCLIASLTLAISPLVTPDGKKWLKKFCDSHAPLGMWLTNKLNVIFMRFVAIGSSARDTFGINAPLNPDPYISARRSAHDFARTLQNAIDVFELPNGFTASNRSPQPQSDPNHPSHQQVSSHSTPHTGNPSRNPTNPRQRQLPPGLPPSMSETTLSELKQLGIVCKANNAPVIGNCPYPKDVKISSSDGKQVRICLNWIFKGRACKFGDVCSRLHLLHINDLSPDNRKAFRDWMKDNELFFCTNRTPNRGRRTGEQR